jgi:hypothetical protein
MGNRIKNRRWQLWAMVVSVFLLFAVVYAQESGKKISSYSPVVITDDFTAAAVIRLPTTQIT